MPIEINQSSVSSMPSILSTISNDRQAYRWFLMIISIHEVQEKLSLKNKIKEQYRALRNVQIIKAILYIAFPLFMIFSFLLRQPWVLVGEILPLLTLLPLFRTNRQCVVSISEQFLLDNFQPKDLSQQTLYQICEYLSKKYNTPSLVDIITRQDFIGRKVLLITILFLPFAYHLKTWQTWIVILTVFSATVAIVNVSIVLRRLK